MMPAMTFRSGGVALAVLLLCACGGKNAPKESESKAESHSAGDERDGHGHEKMPAAVHAFHETLAPLWHGEAGLERTQKTCDAQPTMKSQAEAVVTEATADSKQAATELAASVDALGVACAAAGRPDFEARFHDVHETFHKVLEAPAHH